MARLRTAIVGIGLQLSDDSDVVHADRYVAGDTQRAVARNSAPMMSIPSNVV
jgi:hypothetical protein